MTNVRENSPNKIKQSPPLHYFSSTGSDTTKKEPVATPKFQSRFLNRQTNEKPKPTKEEEEETESTSESETDSDEESEEDKRKTDTKEMDKTDIGELAKLTSFSQLTPQIKKKRNGSLRSFVSSKCPGKRYRDVKEGQQRRGEWRI